MPVKFFVTRTVEVEAESFRDAITKFGDGKHFMWNASPNQPTHTPMGSRIPEAQPIKPITYADWPLWSKALKLVAKPEDKGIGDVIRRTIGEENSEAFKAWFKKTTGKDCGCAGRQARLNIQYPLRHGSAKSDA